MTTSANLDLVRSIYAAWERGNFAQTDWLHPEIEYVQADGPAPGSCKGRAGMAEAAGKWLGAWDDICFEIEGYRELDDERVLVLTHYSGRGKTSGLDIGQMETGGVHLFHIRDGTVSRLVAYFDRERALADLGLAPEGDSP